MDWLDEAKNKGHWTNWIQKKNVECHSTVRGILPYEWRTTALARVRVGGIQCAPPAVIQKMTDNAPIQSAVEEGRDQMFFSLPNRTETE